MSMVWIGMGWNVTASSSRLAVLWCVSPARLCYYTDWMSTLPVNECRGEVPGCDGLLEIARLLLM